MKTKRNILMLLAIFAFISSSMAQLPSYVPTNGLVGYWPFSGNANDESGNGHDGTVYGATLTTDRFGNANSAYSFSTVGNTFGNPGQYIEIANTITSYFNTGCTVSAWINANSLYWPGNTDHRSSIVSYSEYCTGSGGLRFMIGENNQLETTVEFTTWQMSVDNNVISTDSWYHVVTVIEATSIKQYVNGILISTFALTGTPSMSGCLSFGENIMSNGHWYYWDGELDDIGIWNRALTQEEITALYTGNVIDTTLIANYPFNGNANDESGNGNDGVVDGATLTQDRFGNDNSAYNFDVNAWSWGSGGHEIYIPFAENMNSNNISVSAWAKRTSGGNYPSPQPLSIACRFQYGYSTPSGESWILGIDNVNGANPSKIYGHVIDQSQTWVSAISQDSTIEGVWNHIVMTYDGDSLKLFCDGLKVSSEPSNGLILNTQGNSGISVGMSDQANGHWAPFDGDIDDITLWNRAISISEIDSLYHVGGWDDIVCDFSGSPVNGVSPLNVAFTDLSTGSPTSWQWDFGDSSTDTIQNPTHIYQSEGNYTVSLIVADSVSSDTLVRTDYITILPNIQLDFTWGLSCEGEAVQFSVLSPPTDTLAVASWYWDFSDPASGINNTSTLQNPIHYFSQINTFDVSLTIVDTTGATNSLSKQVVVNENPIVEIQADPDIVCVDMLIDFTSIVTDAVVWLWDFGDGNTSSVQNPTHTYSEQGNFTVTLSAETANGCQGYAEYDIVVNENPVAGFNTDSPACLGAPINFYNEATSPTGYIVEWIWDFGDGSTTLTVLWPDNPDVSYVYTLEGTYEATLTVTNSNGCISSVSNEVVVAPAPVADFSFEETCYNLPVYFTDLSLPNGGSGIVIWEWFFGDSNSGTGNHSTLQNPTHIFTEPDSTYITTLIVVNTLGCTDTVEYEITVDSLPYVDFTISDDSICLGETVEFCGVTPPGTGISYWLWDFGDGGYSIEQNTSYTYGSPGEYIVTLTVTEIGPDECQNSISYPIYIKDAPEANFDYHNNCLGDSTNFTDLSYSQNGFISSWEWNFGDGGTSTLEDPLHYYETSNDFEVTLIVTDNYGCTDTISLWVQVYELPYQPNVPDGPIVVDLNVVETSEYLTNLVENATSYQWYLEPAECGNIEGSNIVGTVSWNSTYDGLSAYIYVKAINDCGATSSDSLSINLMPVGTDNINITNTKISVTPNPSNGMFNITIEGSTGDIDMLLSNATGQVIHRERFSRTLLVDVFSINIRPNPAGLYYIVFTGNRINVSKKIIVK